MDLKGRRKQTDAGSTIIKQMEAHAAPWVLGCPKAPLKEWGKLYKPPRTTQKPLLQGHPLPCRKTHNYTLKAGLGAPAQQVESTVDLEEPRDAVTNEARNVCGWDPGPWHLIVDTVRRLEARAAPVYTCDIPGASWVGTLIFRGKRS